MLPSPAPVKRYRILQPVVLGFLTHNDSFDVIVDGGTIESDGVTLHLVNELGRHESHTEAAAVTAWLATGHVEEIV